MSDFVATQLAVPSKTIILTLTIPQDLKERPTYEFEPNELVVAGTTEINIVLDPPSTDPKQPVIVGYCCSHLNVGHFWAHSIFKTRDIVEPPTLVKYSDERFPIDAVRVLFKADLPPRLLVHFGVIVKIDRGNGPEYFLCDPQVGNGPPGTGVLKWNSIPLSASPT